MSIRIFFHHIWYLGWLIVAMLIILSTYSMITNNKGTVKYQRFINKKHVIDSPRKFSGLDFTSIESMILYKTAIDPDLSIVEHFNTSLTI